MERALTSVPAESLSGSQRTVWKLLHLWHQNARTRRQLAELSSLQLADLGISPSERVREISKPFWR
ncbi:hypothetical protein A6723_002060 [Pseudomonas sp. AU11447]|uniref:DUF1127 domain-containing protein n=1 Tax=unclassified Pseudomonas TaxID=196821 RepID=UPI0006D460C7|nr:MULTISPECIES: DUF1127 domain-containing protein [unclassified Pseudomonas]OBY88002.1 hypothetical protein A6723_002060 [Pseudomonas sp. AU11447]